MDFAMDNLGTSVNVLKTEVYTQGVVLSNPPMIAANQPSEEK